MTLTTHHIAAVLRGGKTGGVTCVVNSKKVFSWDCRQGHRGVSKAHIHAHGKPQARYISAICDPFQLLLQTTAHSSRQDFVIALASPPHLFVILQHVNDDQHRCMQQQQDWPATHGPSGAAQHQTTTPLRATRSQRHRAVSTSQPAALCGDSPDECVQPACVSIANSARWQPSGRNRAAAQLSWKAACKWSAARLVPCPPRPARQCRNAGLEGDTSGFGRGNPQQARDIGALATDAR